MDWILKAAIAAAVYVAFVRIVAEFCHLGGDDVDELQLSNPYERLK